MVRAAAVKAGARGLTLVLENEYACNTATGAEAARLLAAIPEKALQLTWDPGNAQFRDEVPFPGGYAALPKERIGHVHCKDAVRRADGKWEWMAMGRGVIDWAGQFRALKHDGYRHAVHARDALARRRHAGRIEPPELCRDEGAARESRDALIRAADVYNVTIHVGLIGAGNISETHARAAAAIPDVAIAGVYAPTRAHAERLAAQHGGAAHDTLDASSIIGRWTSSSSAARRDCTPSTASRRRGAGSTCWSRSRSTSPRRGPTRSSTRRRAPASRWASSFRIG